MASSGLKKMFILQHYIHKTVYQKIFSQRTFFLFIMADVMPYVRLMLLPLLLWKILYHMSRSLNLIDCAKRTGRDKVVA